MIVGGDQPRRPARRDRPEPQLDRPRLGVQAVQQPDDAAAAVHDPFTVCTCLAGVVAVVIGVPAQPGAVQRARVQVPGALVIGQEDQPSADQHRARQLSLEPGQQPPERRARSAGRRRRAPTRRARHRTRPGRRIGSGGRPVTRRTHPQAARGAAAVALPVRRIAVHGAGQQGHPGRLHGQVSHRPVGQPDVARRPRGRLGIDGVGPGEVGERLAGGADGQHLARRRPAARLGPGVAPERELAAEPALGRRQEDLGGVALGSGPGDLRAVTGQPRPAGQGLIGGQPPGAAPVRLPQPDIILGDERDQVAVHMRKGQISR